MSSINLRGHYMRLDGSGHRGCFNYLLTLETPERVWIKVGMSDDPIRRFQVLKCGSPMPPKVLAVVELSNRHLARKAERDLHQRLKRWHSSGEWFEFAPSDRSAFNAVLRAWLADHSFKSQPLKLVRLSAEAIEAAARENQRNGFRKWRRANAAYKDFARASRQAGRAH